MEHFNQRINSLPEIHGQLLATPLVDVLEAKKAVTFKKKGGIYVFYENGIPIYVGRSRDIRHRLSVHTTSDAMGSNFALKLAKENAIKNGIDISVAKNKTQLMAIPGFKDFFIKAKSRIKSMQVRAVVVEDPITQHLLEVYSHLSLGTHQYNNFNTH